MIVNNQEQIEHIQTLEELLKRFQNVESNVLKLENYEEATLTYQQICDELRVLEQSARCLSLFSPNEPLKEVHTEILRLLLIPYYLGDVYGKIPAGPAVSSRKHNLELSKNYLAAYINLCRHYGSEEVGEPQHIFPNNLFKTWKKYETDPNFQIQRDELITNEKEKKLIKTRYENSKKIKEETDERQSIFDWLTLNLYNAVSQMKTINEQMQLLAYKDKLQSDKKTQEAHQQQSNKPIPKLKVWNIRKPEQIQQQFFLPTHHPKCHHCSTENERRQIINKVWTPNSNQPTMTLEQVADMEMENLRIRTEREKKLREENKEDTDSDKEEVDAREKKKARGWDDWKDDHEKGAGNKGHS